MRHVLRRKQLRYQSEDYMVAWHYPKGYISLINVKIDNNILVIVGAGSDWIEAFPAVDRTSETIKVYLSQIFKKKSE